MNPTTSNMKTDERMDGWNREMMVKGAVKTGNMGVVENMKYVQESFIFIHFKKDFFFLYSILLYLT